MERKKNGPKKGAVKKWSEKLEKLGEQAPPEDIMKIINKIEKSKKIAKDRNSSEDLEM